MSFALLTPLLLLPFLQAGPTEPAPPRPARAGTAKEAPARQPVFVKERYAFKTFGGDLLTKSDLIAEVRVESVSRGGPGVHVVRMAVTEAHLSRGAPEVPDAIVTLAAPDDYVAEQEYLVFLERFESGDRFKSLRRIMNGERDYAAKRKVLSRYASLELVRDDNVRARKIRDTLLEFLQDDELFIRWNALAELESFVQNHKLLFDTPHRASIVAALRAEPSPTFRRRLMVVLEEFGIRLEGGKDE